MNEVVENKSKITIGKALAGVGILLACWVAVFYFFGSSADSVQHVSSFHVPGIGWDVDITK